MGRKRVLIILFIVIAIAFSLNFFLPKMSENITEKTGNNTTPIEKKVDSKSHKIKTITINENISLVAATPLHIETTKENSMSELYIRINNKTDTLVKESENQMSFVNFDGSAVINHPDKPGKLFAIYEYNINPQLEEGTQEQRQKGYIYYIDPKGKVDLIHETVYLFDSMSNKDGNVIIYERLPKDDMNRYPSYLKPYERIQMVYKDGKFEEKTRTFINPLEKHKE